MRTRWNKVVCMKRQLEHMKLDWNNDTLNQIHTKKTYNRLLRLVIRQVAVKKATIKPLQKNNLNFHKRK